MLHIKMKYQVLDVELEMNLEHPDHILEEVDREELDMPTNMDDEESSCHDPKMDVMTLVLSHQDKSV